VRENRCLYDKTDASYHNNMLKVKIWQTIASEQGYPGKYGAFETRSNNKTCFFNSRRENRRSKMEKPTR
jgi:hypothetical protein